MYGLSCPFAGVIVDRHGIKLSLASSLFLSGIILYFFFYSHSVIWLFLISGLNGITKSFFDVGCKSYKIFELTPDMRRLYISLRYMAINSAAAIGPALGAYLSSIDPHTTFKKVGIVYLVLCAISVLSLKDASLKQSKTSSTTRSISQMLNVIQMDKGLSLLLLISIIYMIVYAQMDSTLAQHLHASLPNGIKVYSAMLIINAVGCAALQVVVTYLTKNISEIIISTWAMCLFAAGCIIIALFLDVPALITASLIIVLAETLAMPLNDLLISKIAPPDLISTYYGVSGMAILGLGTGPMIGGFIYQTFGAKVIFLLSSLLCLSTIYLYYLLISFISIKDKNQATELQTA